MKRLPRLSALLAAAAFAVLIAMPSSAFAAKTIGISAPKFEFNLSGGQSEKGEIVVMNEGTEQTQVLVYAADQSVDASGAPKYTTPSSEKGTVGQGPASWLQLTLPQGVKTIGNTPYLDLKPGQKAPVKFTFTVPSDTSPGDHQVVVFFEMFDMNSVQKGAVTRVSGRIGSRVSVRVKGQFVENLAVAPFSVRNWIIGDKIPWSFTLANSGNLDEHATIDLQVLDSSESEVDRSRVMTEGPSYAGTATKFAGVMQPKGLGFGSYTFRLTTSYQKQGASQPETITKERKVFVVPLWLIYAAIALVALLLIGLIVLIAQRGSKKKAERLSAAEAAIQEAAAKLVEQQRKAQ